MWKWGDSIASRVHNPNSLPDALETFIPRNWADHLVNLLKDVDEFWLCRCCGLVTPHWLRTTCGGHFRCVKFQKAYKPWVARPGGMNIPAQKAMILSELSTAQAARARTVDTADGSTVHVMLMTWPDTSTDDLMGAFRASAVTCFNELKQMIAEGDDEKILRELDRIVNASLPKYLKRWEYSQSDRDWVVWLNQQGKNVDNPWRYDHLCIDGEWHYRGVIFDYKPTDAVMTYQDVIRLWGINRFILEGHTMSAHGGR